MQPVKTLVSQRKIHCTDRDITTIIVVERIMFGNRAE
jgi:hypothetical protein